MAPNKKYIRKTRYRRKKNRKSSLASKLKSKRNFERKLDSVAEKKVGVWSQNNLAILRQDSGIIGGGIAIFGYVPNQGVDFTEMVGSKINIRYITVELFYGNPTGQAPADQFIGMVSIFVFHEREFGTYAVRAVQDFFVRNPGQEIDSTPLAINPYFYKQGFKKIKQYNLKVGSHPTYCYPVDAVNNRFPGGVFNAKPWIIWKKKFRIFKQVKKKPGINAWDTPGIYILPVRWSGNTTTLIEGADPEMQVKVTMTYTDN